MARGKGGSNSKEKEKETALCSAGPNVCRKPTGDVVWVRCDCCKQWYHCTCVKVSPRDAAEMIYHCKSCKPIKEEEYDEIKLRLKEGLSKIMKDHTSFVTGPIARKCFATKGKSDEYHAESKGVPLTLMELSLKIDGVFQTTDHFADASKKMTKRMKAFLKSEHHDEINRIGKEIEKLTNDSKSKRKTPNGKKVSVNEAESSEEEKPTPNKRKSPARKPPPESAKKMKTVPKKEQKSSFEKEEALRALKAPSEADIKIQLKCESCKSGLNLPIFQCPESHQVCGQCGEKAEKGYCPLCKTTSNRNRRMKKLAKWPDSTLEETQGQKSEKLPLAGAQALKMVTTTVKSPEKATPLAPPASLVTPAAKQGAGPRRPAMLVPRTGPMASKAQQLAQSKGAQTAQPTTLEVLKQVQTIVKPDANVVPQAKGRASRKRRGKSDDLDEETGPTEVKVARQKGGAHKQPELPSATIPDNIMDDGEDLSKPVKLGDLPDLEPMFAAGSPPTAIPKTATVLLSPGQLRGATPQKSQQPMVVTLQPQVIPIQPQARPTLAGALQRSPVPTIITSPIQGTGSTPPVFFKVLKGNSFVQLPTAQDGAQKSPRPILSPTKNIRGTASFLAAGVPTRPQVIFPAKEVRMAAPGGQQPRSIIRPAPPRAIAPNQGPVLIRAVAAGASPKSPQLPVVPLPRTSLNNAQPTQLKTPAPSTVAPSAPVPGLKPAENSMTKAFVWKSSDRTQFKLSARFNFDLFREYQNKHPQKDVRFALATIVTEDRVNEFTFHLTQKKDAQSDEKPWQLGVRSKNPSDHVWHLKVKVDPPILLVNNQKFEQVTNNYEFPRKISDKPVVDYELLLMGKTAASGYNASAMKTADPTAEPSKAQPSPKKAS